MDGKTKALLLLGICAAPGLGQFQREPGNDPGLECGAYAADGWLTIYDGSQASAEKYWWISGGGHGDGGKWWVAEDQDLAAAGKIKPGQKILWSDQNPGGSGGLLYTRRRYRDFEVMVSVFPAWENDGGLFLRASGKGPAWQIMLDYQPGKTVGGIWPEGLVGPSQDFYRLDSETKVTTLPLAKWNAEDWPKIWDPDGFNTIHAKVTGSNQAGPRIKAWITDSNHVVTDYSATYQNVLGDDGHIGLQIHAGEVSWKGGPNKYQWVKVRELDPGSGAPVCKPSALRPPRDALRMAWVGAGGDGLRVSGWVAGAYSLVLADPRGRVLAVSSGSGGQVRHDFPGLAKGVYLVTLRARGRNQSYRAVRL